MKQSKEVCANCKYYENGCCKIRSAKPEIPWHGTVGEKLQKKPTDGCLYWEKRKKS